MKVLFISPKFSSKHKPSETQTTQNPFFKMEDGKDGKDSFVSFTAKEQTNKNSFKKSAPFIMAAILSASSMNPSMAQRNSNFLPTTLSVENKKWWNGFTAEEKKIVEQVENEVAKIIVTTGDTPLPMDFPKIVKKLDIDEEDYSLVFDLLEEHDKNNFEDFCAPNSEHLSPRKQELKQKALVEMFTYTEKTGKLLKYNPKNILALSNRIGAEKDEIPFVKYFLGQYLNNEKN